ncbi:MAG TPA: cytochrome c family protein [Dongiaceae bacterium]|nr:cytochrome c family protein [Dongiaceae bacterium]
MSDPPADTYAGGTADIVIVMSQLPKIQRHRWLTWPRLCAAAVLSLAGICLIGLATVFALAPGDPVRGEQIYQRCFACHAIDRDRTGPRHAGLFGRAAGSVPNFPYSAAMKKAGVSGLVWNDETLNAFLESPTTYIPGTRMGYAGIKDPQERADLIAYLKKATQQ